MTLQYFWLPLLFDGIIGPHACEKMGNKWVMQGIRGGYEDKEMGLNDGKRCRRWISEMKREKMWWVGIEYVHGVGCITHEAR